MNLPSWLPLWAFIVILVIAGLFALWLLTLIVSSIFVKEFSRRLKNGSSAINMLLAERFEIMTSLIKLAKSHDINISKEDQKSISFLERIQDFQKLSKNDRDRRVLSFVHTAHNIISVFDRSEMVNDERYTEKLIEFNDVEESYRQKSAIYNADIIGFNYWVNVPTIKWLFKLFNLRNKDLIV